MLDQDHLLAAYDRPDRSRRWVRANVVSTLDGAASRGGFAGPLGDAEDQLLLRTLRQLADVVVVGAGTVRVEGYGGLGLDESAVAWRRSQGLSDVPPLVIVSSALNLEPGAEVFATPEPRPIVVTHRDAPARRRERLGDVAEVVVCGEHEVEPRLLLAELESRGMTQVLTEGGPRLFASFLEADVVDELCLTLAPTLEGGDAVRVARGGLAVGREMRVGHVLHGERMLFLRYERAR